MAFNEISRFWPRSDFVALAPGQPVDLPLFQSHINSVVFDVPPVAVMHVPEDALRIDWQQLPTEDDIAALDAKVASFAGGATSNAPIEINAFAPTTTQSSSHVTKVDHTTPPLAAGTYQVLWSSSLRMTAVAANTGVEGKVRVTRSDGIFVEQVDSWDLANSHAFNGALTFVVQAGQTIRVQLSYARLGASNTAEMAGARVTIDQLSAAA